MVVCSALIKACAPRDSSPLEKRKQLCIISFNHDGKQWSEYPSDFSLMVFLNLFGSILRIAVKRESERAVYSFVFLFHGFADKQK